MVFRRSFFSFLVTLKDDIDSSNEISAEEVLARPGSFILDFFFVLLAVSMSIVGAVVMISGAVQFFSLFLAEFGCGIFLRAGRGGAASA
jgi:hypothetical protein